MVYSSLVVWFPISNQSDFLSLFVIELIAHKPSESSVVVMGAGIYNIIR
jgi:hypothetical protein